jgi:hypothetical protein
MFKCFVAENDERTTNKRRTNELIGPNFRDLIGTNSDRLVQIPTIGPNSEQLVRIPNDWSEFRTNDEFDVATDMNASDVLKFVKVLNAQKKLAWTDLDRVSFKKFVKQSSVKIKKLAWTGLGKVKKASSAASVFKISSQLVTQVSPKRFVRRWPDLDKRCSRCYTLRGCVLADVQSREELKMLLQAKRQPG